MMDKITANYTRQTEFPLDEETLQYLQDNQSLLEILGNIAGDKVILSGCTAYNSGTMRQSGYVFLRTKDCPTGEILKFEGGSVSAGIYLKKTAIDVTANNVEYAGAYTKRSLAPGIGDENFAWGGFGLLHTNSELKALCENLQSQIDLLTPPPIGIVQMWAGTAANIPKDYALCDGRELPIASHPSLYAVLGTQFNTKKNWNGVAQTTTSGMFRLPDLRGRFVVGKNDSSNESEYAEIGNAAGEKKHLLTDLESGLPAHSHGFNQGISSNSKRGTTGSESLFSTFNGGTGLSILNNTAKNALQSHENRPPYYVLAYIMRLK